MILSPMNINPDSHSPTIWKSFVLRDRLGTLGDLSESFGTATWLENIVLKPFGYPLTFLGEGTWLKSVVLKECRIPANSSISQSSSGMELERDHR